MKRRIHSYIIATIMLVGLGLQASAQDLIIESSCTDPILVHIDGICMNAVPQQAVIIDQLDYGFHNIEVEVIRDRGFHSRTHRHGVRHGRDILFAQNRLVTRPGRQYIMAVNVSPCGTFASLRLVHEEFIRRSARQYYGPVGRTLQGNSRGQYGHAGYGRGVSGSRSGNISRQRGRAGFGRGTGGQGRGSAASRQLLDVNRLLNVLDGIPFDSERLEIANLAISQSGGLFTEDVRRIMEEFSFDRNRLALAKQAFVYTVDKENYFTLNQELVFSSSRRELSRFIATA